MEHSQKNSHKCTSSTLRPTPLQVPYPSSSIGPHFQGHTLANRSLPIFLPGWELSWQSLSQMPVISAPAAIKKHQHKSQWENIYCSNNVVSVMCSTFLYFLPSTLYVCYLAVDNTISPYHQDFVTRVVQGLLLEWVWPHSSHPFCSLVKSPSCLRVARVCCFEGYSYVAHRWRTRREML